MLKKNCVKQTPKTFKIVHFLVHTLAHGAFTSPKVDKKIGTLYEFKNTQ